MKSSSAPALDGMRAADAYARLGLDSRDRLALAELANLRRLDQLESESASRRRHYCASVVIARSGV